MIIHMQIQCLSNQDATKYGNVIQTLGDMVFENSSMATHIKCGGFSFKEKGCNESSFITGQVHTECIYCAHAY